MLLNIFRVRSAIHYFSISFIAIAAALLCSGYQQKEPSEGEVLARQYCSSCHLFPDPSLLDKETWKTNVLPNMGWRLGVRKPGDNPFAGLKEDEHQRLLDLNVFPASQLISSDHWKKIVNYYIQQAPEKPIPSKPLEAYKRDLTMFHGEPLFIGENQTPQTTLVKFDSIHSLMYIGDAQNEVYVIDQTPQLLANWQTVSPAVDMLFSRESPPKMICIGSLLPSEEKTGTISYLDSVLKPQQTATSIGNLGRPVQMSDVDLNGDGIKDLLLCQFGNFTGKISWFDGGDAKKEHIIKLQAGARRAEISDMNKDGKPDIVVLFAQARESVSLFENLGDGTFSEKILMQFPPVQGSTYLELDDFNKDGFPDILMSSGDNWDLSDIHKRFHGVRIYMNDGKNNFAERFFFPLYGASKAMARDFDKDGDLDIAAISFHDNPEKPEDGFVYLENTGNMHFIPHVTADARSGKWLTMDVADLDKDGDDDIMLGSYFHAFSEVAKLMVKGVEQFPQVVILRNNHFQKK